MSAERYHHHRVFTELNAFPLKPRVAFQTLLTYWKNMLLERWFPRRVSYASLYVTFGLVPAWDFKHF